MFETDALNKGWVRAVVREYRPDLGLGHSETIAYHQLACELSAASKTD